MVERICQKGKFSASFEFRVRVKGDESRKCRRERWLEISIKR